MNYVGFNEAAANRGGIPRELDPQITGPCRFNEAAANRGGILPSPGEYYHEQGLLQ